jgi:hypothetical protein
MTLTSTNLPSLTGTQGSTAEGAAGENSGALQEPCGCMKTLLTDKREKLHFPEGVGPHLDYISQES